MILITADDLGAHEFESGKRNSRELALTDWVRVAGLLIFVPAFFPVVPRRGGTAGRAGRAVRCQIKCGWP
jgi:hypothetical protein